MPKDPDLELEMESEVPKPPRAKAPRVQSDKTIRTVKRPRPLVEGINSPTGISPIFAKPPLTDEERQLISETGDLKMDEPRLLSVAATKRAGKKSRNLGKIVIVGIILLLLVFGAYKTYLWYLNRPSGYAPDSSLDYSQTNSSQALGSNIYGNASSTAGSMPLATSTQANSATMTASSTFSLAGGMTMGSTTPPTTPGVATPTPAPQLTINKTPTGYLNVRSGPSTSDSVLTQVNPGAVYGYTAVKNGWYQIVLPGGQTGWVVAQYVTLK